MWWLLAAFGALTVGRIAGNFLHHERQRRWKKALESCGFEVVWRADSRGMQHAFGLRSGSAAIRIEDLGGRIVVVAVPAPRSLSGVIVRHERYRPPEVPKLQTGDELFDSELWISGPEQLLRGLLDAETRRLLLGLDVKDCLEITRDEIRVETSAENLPNALPLALALRGRFARRADIAKRLSENARNDPEAGVRLQNLLLLIHDHPGKPPTLYALRKACSDPAPEIRLRAALASGGARNHILVKLAESLVADPVSAEAVSALGRELPFERLRTILDHALDRRRAQTARACLEALGRSGDPAAVDVLAEAMARADGKTAAAAALALGATGSPAAEPPLLLALQREDTQVAAADALARAGTAAAVLPLEEAAERAKDKELRRAARQAVAEIHSRLHGASPGQLSLSGTEGGELSLSDSEAGQLSLSSDPAGQLSLPSDPAPSLPSDPAGQRSLPKER